MFCIWVTFYSFLKELNKFRYLLMYKILQKTLRSFKYIFLHLLKTIFPVDLCYYIHNFAPKLPYMNR